MDSDGESYGSDESFVEERYSDDDDIEASFSGLESEDEDEIISTIKKSHKRSVSSSKPKSLVIKVPPKSNISSDSKKRPFTQITPQPSEWMKSKHSTVLDDSDSEEMPISKKQKLSDLVEARRIAASRQPIPSNYPQNTVPSNDQNHSKSNTNQASLDNSLILISESEDNSTIGDDLHHALKASLSSNIPSHSSSNIDDLNSASSDHVSTRSNQNQPNSTDFHVLLDSDEEDNQQQQQRKRLKKKPILESPERTNKVMQNLNEDEDVDIDVDSEVIQKPTIPINSSSIKPSKPVSKPKYVSKEEFMDDDNFGSDDDDFDNHEVKFDTVLEKCQQISKKLKKHLDLSKVNLKIDEKESKKKKDQNSSETELLLTEQPSLLTKPLKDYQLVGLNWLRILHLENLNGILADEMGLGKTIQTIALLSWIKENRQKNIAHHLKSEVDRQEAQTSNLDSDHKLASPSLDYLNFSGKECDLPHIVICPSSTIRNWARELETWSPTLRVVVYHGSQPEREEIRDNILSYYKKHKEYDFDVLITTYQICGGKFDRSFLQRKMQFFYLIVDEAQMLKGKETNRYNQLMQIQSSRRLLLTGTPLQNNLDELLALLIFLMPKLFSGLKGFSMGAELKLIKSQGRKLSESDYALKMKKILKPFIMRRLKLHVGLGLLPKLRELIEIDPAPIQKDIYNEIYRNSKRFWDQLNGEKAEALEIIDEDCSESNLQEDTIFDAGALESLENNEKSSSSLASSSTTLTNSSPNAVDAGNTRASNSGFMANLLMQMRKVANHPALVRAFYSEDDVMQFAQTVHARETKYAKWKVNEVAEDFSCRSDMELHRMTAKYPASLGHLRLTNDQIFNSSGKFIALSTLLPELHQKGHRVVLFSQFTTVLDLLEIFLQQKLGFEFLRLDGNTPVSERQEILDQFNRNPNKYFVFLASTLAGGLGVNLTSADTVIFHDISFNPQVDRQAEDRCHRLGQEKVVTVYNLIMKDSVEEHMFRLAHEKTELNDLMLNEGKFADSDGTAQEKMTGRSVEKVFMKRLVQSMASSSKKETN